MNERALRPGSVAAAAAVIGGLLIVVLPQHGLSIVRLGIVTVAAAAGLYALALHVPPTWWTSPLDRRAGRSRRGRRSDEVDAIHSTLSGRRQAIAHGPPLPPETLRLLQPLIRGHFEQSRSGLEETGPEEAARRRLSPLSQAVLASEPMIHPAWFRTIRPDPRETAAAVHRVLDELERLDGGRKQPPDPPAPPERHDRTADHA